MKNKHQQHYKMSHLANEFIKGTSHINGIKSFSVLIKARWARLRGIDKNISYLHFDGAEHHPLIIQKPPIVTRTIKKKPNNIYLLILLLFMTKSSSHATQPNPKQKTQEPSTPDKVDKKEVDQAYKLILSVMQVQSSKDDLIEKFYLEKTTKERLSKDKEQLNCIKENYLGNEEPVLLAGFKELNHNHPPLNKAQHPSWRFLIKAIAHNHWKIVDFIYEKVLSKKKKYGYLDDIDVEKALTILDQKKNKPAVEVLWKLAKPSQRNFFHGLFWQALIKEKWEIAETLLKRDTGGSLRLLDRFVSRTRPNYKPKFNPNSVYQLFQGRAHPKLRKFFITRLSKEDLKALCEVINTAKEIKVFKEILGTAGSWPVWSYIAKELQHKMLAECYDSLPFSQTLWYPRPQKKKTKKGLRAPKENECEWLCSDVEKDLIPYARKRLAQKIAKVGGITILGGGLLWLVIYAMRLVRKKEMTRR